MFEYQERFFSLFFNDIYPANILKYQCYFSIIILSDILTINTVDHGADSQYISDMLYGENIFEIGNEGIFTDK